MRWPKGPPHLTKTLIFCFFVVFCFIAFLSLFLIEKPFYPPSKKGIFVYLYVSPFVYHLPFLWPPPLSLYFFLSVSCPSLSSFLLVSHVSFWVLLLVFVLFVFFLQDVLLFFGFLLVVLFVWLYYLYFWFCTVFSCCCCCLLLFCLVFCFDIVFVFDVWPPIKKHFL